MGYDPTVHRVLDSEGKTQYVYTIEDSRASPKYFLTQQSLSELHTLRVAGRSTRVWQVVEVCAPKDISKVRSTHELVPVCGAHSMVLKDAWLHLSGSTEGRIQDSMYSKLHETARSLADVDDEDTFLTDILPSNDDTRSQILDVLRTAAWTKYFLTIVVENEGAQTKTKAEHAKAVRGLFDQPDPPNTPASLSSSDPNRGQGSQPSNTRGVGLPRNHPGGAHEAKKRYRVVFRELCKPLHQLPDFGDVCSAMTDCLLGEYLRDYGKHMILTARSRISAHVPGGLRTSRHQQR
jgi:hypothetical protein